VRLVKAFDVRRIKPRALVLGTSRSHVAIRTTHPGWDTLAQPRYNLAFDGATTHEMYAYLRHAQANAPLRQVVLGLDTWQLDPFPSGTRPGFDQSILDDHGQPFAHLASRVSSLRIAFSADATLGSVQTLMAQADPQQGWLASDGQRLGDVFFHRPDEEYVSKGPGAYFADVDRQEAGFKLDTSDNRPRRAGGDTKADLSSLEYIRLIIEFCRINGIDLRLFITPAHAHQMEISAAAAEWSKIEDGKRELVRLLSDDAARHPGLSPFVLYDFSGYSSVTEETVPSTGSQREMDYYWDSSHFKESVGDWVLDRVFTVKRENTSAPVDFGVLLTPETIDPALSKIRMDRARYRSEHPKDIANIRKMIAEVWEALPTDRRASLEGAE
jgi:hypothetical protein